MREGDNETNPSTVYDWKNQIIYLAYYNLCTITYILSYIPYPTDKDLK